MRPIVTLLLILMSAYSWAQADKEDYFSLTFENDAIALPGLTDKYYTNGLRFERMGPGFADKNYLLNKILFRFKRRDGVDIRYGSFFGQNIYTPKIIDSTDIQYHDRPFSGWLYRGVKCMSTNAKRSRRITSEFYLGVIGPYAFAGETQIFIHKVTQSTMPTGWSHQIDSDLGFNYVFRLEGMLFSYPNNPVIKFSERRGTKSEHVKTNIELTYLGEANAGTVFNNIVAGSILRIGYMTPYLRSYNFGSGPIIKLLKRDTLQAYAKALPNNKVKKGLRDWSQFFLFIKPQLRATLYNAMLQGGLLNKESDYVVKKSDIEPITLQVDYGIGVTFRSFTLNYYQSIRSKEFSFSQARNHYWGGLNLIFNY